MLFFTDYGNVAKLERCNMDGTNRTRLVTEHVEQPTAVALDLVRKLVYWADAYLDYIEVVDYEGNNRHTIIQGLLVRTAAGGLSPLGPSLLLSLILVPIFCLILDRFSACVLVCSSAS